MRSVHGQARKKYDIWVWDGLLILSSLTFQILPCRPCTLRVSNIVHTEWPITNDKACHKLLKMIRKPCLSIAPTSSVQRTRINSHRHSTLYYVSIAEKGTFSSCDLELWTTTLTFQLDKIRAKLNYLYVYLKHLGHRSLSWQAMIIFIQWSDKTSSK